MRAMVDSAPAPAPAPEGWLRRDSAGLSTTASWLASLSEGLWVAPPPPEKLSWKALLTAARERSASPYYLLLSEERLEEVRTILSSVTEGSAASMKAFKVKKATYHTPVTCPGDDILVAKHQLTVYDGGQPSGVGGSAYAAPAEAPKQVYIFNQLQIFEQVAPADTRPSRSNESEVPINTVRSGGLVHVQIGEQAEEEYGSAFARRAEVCFFKLLHGSIRTQRGVLKMFPTVRSELVLAIKDPTEQLTLGSLRENLLYGLTCETKPDDKQLWDACSYLGLSKALIGEEYAEGWAKTKLSAILSWASPVDLCKLVLVRPLLRCPDLLMLSCTTRLLAHRPTDPLTH